MTSAGGTAGQSGGQRATGRGWRHEARRGAIAVVGAALAISMTQLPVWAEGETASGTTGATADASADGGTSPADPGAPPPADSVGEGAIPPPASAPAPPTGGGLKYGGRSTGPSPLPTLLDDPNFPVPAPPTNESLPKGVELPEEVDDPGVFQRNVICDPVAKPGVIAVVNMLGQAYGRPGYSLARPCIDLRSEHYDGRAVDWQLNAFDPMDRRIGDAAVTWLTENDGDVAHRLGIQSIIWNNHAWHSSDSTWKGYVGQSAHTDHVHISLNWDGADMRTSWWTGVALTAEDADQGPCEVIGGAYAAVPQASRAQACVPAQVWPADTGYNTIRPGGQGGGVGLIQPLLKVPQTGVFDAATRAALLVWQDKQGIPQTGVLDQLTYAAALGWELPDLPEGALAVHLPDYRVTEFTPYKRTALTEGDQGKGVKVLQEALGVDADGDFGPLTAKALTKFAKKQPLLLDDLSATDTLVWEVLERRAYPHLVLRDIELEIGAEGYPVQVLQQFLDLEDDGIFGPMTQQGVLDAQAAAELEQTGIVDGATWQVIDDAATAHEQERRDEAKAEKKAAKQAKQAKAEKKAAKKAAKKAKDEQQLEKSAKDSARQGATGNGSGATSKTDPAALPVEETLIPSAVR